MAYEQWYPDETKEEWAAFILACIVTGIITCCVFGVRSCVRNNKKEKSKTEQITKNFVQPKDFIAYNNVKTY